MEWNRLRTSALVILVGLVATFAFPDSVVVQAVLTALAYVGALSLVMRVGPPAVSSVVRAMIAAVLTTALVMGLAADGSAQLVLGLAFWALIGVGGDQLARWVPDVPGSMRLPGATTRRRPTRRAEAPASPTRLADGADAELENEYRLAEQGGDLEAAHWLGLLLEQRGDLDGAADAYRRAEANGDPLGAYGLGDLLERSGDQVAADAAFLRGDELKRLRQRRNPPRSRRVRRHPPGPPAAPALPWRVRCPICEKDVFPGADAAWSSVAGSQRRFARGTAGGYTQRLERAYFEPRCGNWHVTKQS